MFPKNKLNNKGDLMMGNHIEVIDVKTTNNGCGQMRQGCVEVQGGTTEACTNEPVAITPLEGPVPVKIPVVLAELTLQIHIMSNIDLPEPALEIKNIKKRVKITQCLLLQDTNVLFISGFIRKNIDYSTLACGNTEGVCGDIRHCTVDVPFRCTTPVTFNGIAPEFLGINTSNEFEYFKTENLPSNFAEKDKLLSGDLSEYNQISTEFFNELPFCELISSRIVEFDEYLNRAFVEGTPFEERVFTSIEEKMVVFLTLKILQNRQVLVPGV